MNGSDEGDNEGELLAGELGAQDEESGGGEGHVAKGSKVTAHAVQDLVKSPEEVLTRV